MQMLTFTLMLMLTLKLMRTLMLMLMFRHTLAGFDGVNSPGETCSRCKLLNGLLVHYRCYKKALR